MALEIKANYQSMRRAFNQVRKIGGITSFESRQASKIRDLAYDILNSPQIQDFCLFLFPIKKIYKKIRDGDLVSKWRPAIKPLIKTPEYSGKLIPLKGCWDNSSLSQTRSIPTEEPALYLHYASIKRGERRASPPNYCNIYIVFDASKSVDENVRLILGNQHTCFVAEK
ncbi:hypothetical protein AMJ44_11235 [candidate division WOR-1 bacterium DG_54_3]|uniref:Uncharacterized protein n=1 Tax=candidate division WOR-1 bacterium DG_54_3 TaxID=1703775 RepID=A0A0S7XSK9_UNCSA|nr:MAG: hypothetical protein AMJ44_11235 [candidate division WOR-1 bacterium DG_54_3]